MELTGVGAAPGIAVGPIWRHAGGASGGQPVLDVRLAAELASGELLALAARVRAAGRTEDAEIFEAQSMMALDPMVLEAIKAHAAATHPVDADALADVVDVVAAEHAAMIAALPDETLAARAADVRDVGARIARIVAGRSVVLPDRASIAVADDLPPSIAAEMSDGLLLGVALERGSTTSHAAILARGLGIPAVVGVPGLLAAGEGRRPSRRQRDRRARWRRRSRHLSAVAPGARRAPRGRRAARAEGAVARALRGSAGPYRRRAAHRAPRQHRPRSRTPIALSRRVPRAWACSAPSSCSSGASPPSEDEQARAYRRVLLAFGERPVVIRLIDVGGDKPLPYLRLAPEANPFLGVRGFRLVTDHRQMLLEQVRAIARAGAGAPSVPRVMAPMVSTIEDVELVHGVVDEALAVARRCGHPAGRAPRGRDHDRGPERDADGPGARAPRRLLQRREQRPDPVRARDGPDAPGARGDGGRAASRRCFGRSATLSRARAARASRSRFAASSRGTSPARSSSPASDPRAVDGRGPPRRDPPRAARRALSRLEKLARAALAAETAGQVRELVSRAGLQA